ncbi:MAG TPA: bifunctional metallophosphatase/5'-nucleotidase, partial [Chryseolinea sp.]
KGKRINWIKVKGEPIVLTRTYTVVACERDGDPETMICRMENVKDPKVLGTTLHKLIEEYLRVHSPISPKLEGRATATDAPATLLTQLTGVGYEFR